MKNTQSISTHIPALKSRWVTVPNILTFSRIVLTPFIVWGLIHGYWKLVFSLFVCAGLTDMLDGFIARRYNAESVIGTFLDPIADKILFVSLFTTLFLIKFPSVPLPSWFIFLVLIRELVILCGALIVVWRRPHAVIQPTKGGKLTICGYTLLIGWLFLCYFCSWMPLKSFSFVLHSVASLALFSLCQYLWRGVRWLFSAS